MKLRIAQNTKSPDKPVKLGICASRIEVDPKQLIRESRRAGFPWRKLGKKRLVIPSEVLKWRSENIVARPSRQKKAKAAPPPADTNTAPNAVAGSLFGGSSIDAMKSGTASALEVNRALVQILSRKFAQDAELGNVSAMAVNGIKQALQELRQAEQDYVEMSVRNRDMIPRADVMAMVGTMMARMFRVHGNFENSVATEFSLWLADPKVQAMETADRARVIREFVAKAAADVRRMEADGVEKLIDAK